MQVSIERLRIWLLAGGCLLVLVIAGFLGYAHYRAHAFLKGLPGHLGVDIKQETNGYTYSQSVGGKTVFTIHAARAIQRKDGKWTLHDVGIVLYGRKQDRADRISGSEFEYDQNTGVIRAMGEVHLDLEAPTAAEGRAAKGARVVRPEGEAKPVIHIRTSGLVYLQKLGVAATDEPIEFQSGGWTGRSKGADYSADTGLILMHSDVSLTGLAGERPVVITGARAELNRESQLVVLTAARCVSLQDSVQAEQATVHLRTDGSPERIEAAGNVTFVGEGRGVLTGARAEIALDEQNRARSAHLSGGLRYVDDQAQRQASGQANEAIVSFDALGRAQHVTLLGGPGAGGVQMHVRQRGLQDAWSTRDIQAGRIELALGMTEAGKLRLKGAQGLGSARVAMVNPGKINPGPGAIRAAAVGGRTTAIRTEIVADDLTAQFVQVGAGVRISALHGVGHTGLRRVADAVDESTQGDRVEVSFVTGAQARKVAEGSRRNDQLPARAVPGGAERVASAVQAGNVRMTRRQAPMTGVVSSGEQHATAEQAEFDGAANRLTLTGGVQMNSESDALSATRVVMDEATGDARADGGVKATYVQAASAPKPTAAARSRQLEPIHILADRAEMNHAAQTAFFYAANQPARPARMWQGGSQVEAPVLEFYQKQRRVVARGIDLVAPAELGIQSVSNGVVHTVLVGAASGKAEARQTAVLRIASHAMTYSDAERQADFTGGVRVQDADGTMRAHQATAYLAAPVVADSRPGPELDPAPATVQSEKGAVATSGLFAGSVEKVVATGRIEIEQPGRKATGEQVVYTARDGMFVLTGTASAPPRLVDGQRGTVTGASLRFHSGDDSVLVSGGAPGTDAGGQQVHTETRVKQK